MQPKDCFPAVSMKCNRLSSVELAWMVAESNKIPANKSSVVTLSLNGQPRKKNFADKKCGRGGGVNGPYQFSLRGSNPAAEKFPEP